MIEPRWTKSTTAAAPPSTAPAWAVHLPKAHLHLHLGGSCPAWLWKRFAAADRAEFRGDCAADGFGAFSRHYDEVVGTIQMCTSPTSLVRALAAQARAEGTWWLELQVNPDHWANWTTLAQLVQACQPSVHGQPIGIGIVVLAAREDPQRACDLAKQAAEHVGAGVVGFGVAGDQRAAPLWQFANAFDLARNAGLALVPHAGEGTEGMQDVRWAADFGCERIAHGVAAQASTELCERLAAAGTCLDVAVHSNWIMNTISGAGHPLVDLMEAGVHCSINSDNPLLVGHDLATEYAVVAQRLGLSWAGVAAAAYYSIVHSLAPPVLRQNALTALGKWAALRDSGIVIPVAVPIG